MHMVVGIIVNITIHNIYIIHNHAKPVRNLVVTVTPGGGKVAPELYIHNHIGLYVNKCTYSYILLHKLIHLAKLLYFTNLDFPGIRGPISLTKPPFGGCEIGRVRDPL